MSNRVALVIGNTAYEQGPLKNPVNDAALITARLVLLGYEIVGGASSATCPTAYNAGANPTWQQTFDLVQQFMARIKPGTIALVYYAGHALQVGDQNFLMPVDTDLSPGKPNLGLVKIKPFIEQAAGLAGSAGTVVAFLDACRNNPLDHEQIRVVLGMLPEATQVEHGQRGPVALSRGGLATLKMDRNADRARTFIGFASAPGDVAYDGKRGNPNSPFAAALDRHLATRGLEIEEFYNRVARDVLDQVDLELGCYQDPWEETNLNRTFYLHPSSGLPVAVLGLAGLVVGLVVCWAVFDNGRVINPVPQLTWGLGALFGIVTAIGTIKWGSENLLDAVFAFFGPVVGFALALALLQIIPAYDAGRPPTVPGTASAIAQNVYTGVTVFGGLLFYLGTALVWTRNLPEWPKTGLQWVNRILTFLLPLIVVGVLLRLQFYLSKTDPLLTATAMFAVLGGVCYAASMALALRAQRGLFGKFGPFTGAITVGLLMSAIFAVYVAVVGIGPDAMSPQRSNYWLIGFGALWHALLGAQLGYCFAYYVPDHKKWAP